MSNIAEGLDDEETSPRLSSVQLRYQIMNIHDGVSARGASLHPPRISHSPVLHDEEIEMGCGTWVYPASRVYLQYIPEFYTREGYSQASRHPYSPRRLRVRILTGSSSSDARYIRHRSIRKSETAKESSVNQYATPHQALLIFLSFSRWSLFSSTPLTF